MRIITLGVVATALLGLVACSDSDDKGQEIKDTCKAKCAITAKLPPSCKAQQVPCENACKTLALEKAEPLWPGCGLCVAKTFKWLYKEDPPCDKNPADPQCWCNYQGIGSPNDQECRASCSEPDGGGAY
jgi:hypothetical protein